jgi:hypothetical protein
MIQMTTKKQAKKKIAKKVSKPKQKGLNPLTAPLGKNVTLNKPNFEYWTGQKDPSQTKQKTTKNKKPEDMFKNVSGMGFKQEQPKQKGKKTNNNNDPFAAMAMGTQGKGDVNSALEGIMGKGFMMKSSPEKKAKKKGKK